MIFRKYHYYEDQVHDSDGNKIPITVTKYERVDDMYEAARKSHTDPVEFLVLEFD